jgi:hypothetical protein
LNPGWWGAPLVQEDNCWRKAHEFRRDDEEDNDGDVCNLFTNASNKVSDSTRISSATICSEVQRVCQGANTRILQPCIKYLHDLH